MKKILLLGGSKQQIPAIKYANEQGYYTILCDYLPDNPGQNYAKEFHCISTTDKEAILDIAKRKKINGIVAYASDPAASTAAYVAEKMGLPSNPYDSVLTLAYKDRFRKFLQENNFNCPRSKSYLDFNEAQSEIGRFNFPILVKPIDSSGSKGVAKIEDINELESAFVSALKISREKKVIIEEFIEMDHTYLIGGDCFILDGKVEFLGLLNCHRNSNVNPLVPVGKSYPISISDKRIDQIKSEMQRVVDLLNIKFGSFNIEIIFDEKDRLYFIEIGPRNGGNMIPELLHIATDIDLIGATIETALGTERFKKTYNFKQMNIATYNLHSEENGKLKNIIFDEEIEKRIVKKILYKNIGDDIEYFDGANKALGIVFLEFDSFEQMTKIMDNPDQWVKIILE